MARIAGVDLPRNKNIEFALPYIFGIGHSFSKQILKDTDIDPNIRVIDLSEDQILLIRNRINDNYTVEGDLRGMVSRNVKRLMDIGTYKGLRHRRGLPVNGQRTKTNARTRKGKVKRAIARRG